MLPGNMYMPHRGQRAAPVGNMANHVYPYSQQYRAPHAPVMYHYPQPAVPNSINMMRQTPTGMHGHVGFHSPQPKKGGLLSRLFGRSNSSPVSPASFFTPPSQRAAGAVQALSQAPTSKASLSSILANTQKVLNAAEQFGPMVQQYGPVVKNLPAMWKIYRGLKSSSSKKDSADNSDTRAQERVSGKKPTRKETKTVPLIGKSEAKPSTPDDEFNNKNENNESKTETKLVNNAPRPKLFF
ncbi:VrrA/YqfQ family protein [Peribacillus sp. SCS-155]|uniref:VrrA/YqfQ family protein n=1 Tax=Peribacillus sedimenti TaxID=3115297 RepID=UPI003905DED8